MNAGVAGMIMIGGVIVTAVGGYQLATIGDAPFNYKTATPEQRATYLDDHGGKLAKTIKRGLISPSGVGPSFKLQGYKVNADRNTITYNIKVSGRMAKGQQFRAAKSHFLKGFCPIYLRNTLGQNGITLVQDIRDGDKKAQGRITVSSSTCSRYAS